MIEAWLSASEMIASSSPSSVSNRPPLASKQERVEDRVLHAEEGGDPRLELLVLLLRAADEAHRGHAVAIAVERLLGGRDQLGVVGEAEKSGNTLTWALPDIPVGGKVTVRYAVQVDADALGVTMTNLATPTSPGGSRPSEPDCTTTHDTPPAWTLKKTSDPASGTDVDAGSTIKYTLTATNVGKAVVTGAKAKDDLTKVTPFADVLTPLPAGLTRSGSTLTWAIPDIAVGKSVSVTFSVKVHSDASNVTVANHATVASPDGRCTRCSTHHHVPKEPPLASTGVPVDEFVGWASVLVLLGGLLLIAGRRRRTQ